MNKVSQEGKAFFIHALALVETENVGLDTRVWAWSHIQKDVKIGERCNIGEQCFIEHGVRIGNEVVIKNGVSLWTGITIEDRVFIGPNASFTNDLFPRAKLFRDEYDKVLVQEGSSIGANATIIGPRIIGKYSIIGGGSVVTSDVPDFALVFGVPATIRGWVCRCGTKLAFKENRAICNKCRRSFLSDASKLVREDQIDPVQRKF